MNKVCDTKILYEEYKDKLTNLVNSRIGDNESAKDIVHDTFEKFEVCCQTSCNCEYPKAYLFKMALNTIADFHKKNKKQKNVELKSEIEQQNEEIKLNFPCNVYKCVYKYLSKLSPANREAYIKSDIKNIPQNIIAKDLGIPFSTLKSRIQRTRKHLKKEFEKCLVGC